MRVTRRRRETGSGTGIGRGLSSAEVMRQATARYSRRLVREMVVKESPVAEVSFMAAKDSRPVREEVVDRVSVGSPGEPVVFGGGLEAGRHSLWPPLERPMSPNLVEM